MGALCDIQWSATAELKEEEAQSGSLDDEP